MKKEQQIELGDTFISYWQSLRPCDCLPLSSKFAPQESLKALLPHILILEIIEGDIKLALVGPGHDERLQVNAMGHSYMDTLPPERRYSSMIRIQAMLQNKCGARIEIEEEMEDGETGTIHGTVLPFAGDEARNPCLIAIIPPNTLASEAHGNPAAPFLGKPMSSFEYLDLGFGIPSQVAEKIMGVVPVGPDDELSWPDLKELVEGS